MRLTACDSAIEAWIHAERYLGGGTRDYSPFSADMDLSAEYRPTSGAPAFRLKSFWLDTRSSRFFAGGSSPLHRIYRNAGRLLMVAHPDALGGHAAPVPRWAEPGPGIECSPLANGRTVLVRKVGDAEVPAHFLKLHMPRRISRFTRPIRQDDVLQHLWVSRRMSELGMPHLPEVGGAVTTGAGTDAGGWGYLIRRPRHVGMRPGQVTIPGFALYGTDVTSPRDATLLEQIVTAWGGDPESIVCDLIVRPLVYLWVRSALGAGCLTELHGQNVLVSFSSTPMDLSVGFRDGGIFVDQELADRTGTGDLPPMDVLGRDILADPIAVRSLTYDSFFGNHFAARLQRLLCERFAVADGVVSRAARQAFAEAGGHRLAMPEHVYYYDERLHEGDGWKLRNTGVEPRWR